MDDLLHYLTLPKLLEGALTAVRIAAVAQVISLGLGLVLALGRSSKLWVARAVCGAYIWLIRGTPLLLQLLFLYNVLPSAGITFGATTTAIIGLGLNSAAFAAEVIRGGLISVPQSQRDAAASLGMSPLLAFWRVQAPQAMRVVVPALVGLSILLIKETSLASVIAVSELTLRSQQIVAVNFDYIPVYAAAALLYLAATSVLVLVQRWLERRLDVRRKADRQARRAPADGGAKGWQLAAEIAAGVVPTPDEVASSAPATSPDDEASPDPLVLGTMPVLEHAGPETTEVPLVVEELTKSFGATPVLDGISLTVERGEVVCVLGPSGSGKTTFLRIVGQLEPPTSGVVRVSGHAVGTQMRRGRTVPITSERRRARLRRATRVGFVFQGFNLFEHRSALDNVMEAPVRVYKEDRAEARAHALALLDAVGLADRAHHYPHQLSGGQQQRVAIARAMALTPDLILFDEPTSALDPELTGEVLAVMRRLAQAGMTMVVVTHEVAFARQCATRVVFMADGAIVEDGPPEQVLDAPRVARTRAFLRQISEREPDMANEAR